MEDAQGTYNHKEEVKGMNISLGNEEIDSNGHKGMVEPVELIKP
jgi:hypothetical protein